MSDVSFMVLAAFDRVLRQSGRSLDDFLDGTGVSVAEIHTTRRARIPWDDFATICERAAKALGGPDGVERLGMQFVNERPGIIGALASRFAKPHTLYYVGVRWYGPSLFKGAAGTVTTMPDGLIESLTLPESFSECPEFYSMMLGLLRAVPTLVGWPMAEVECSFKANEAAYRIRLVPPADEAIDLRELEVERQLADAHLDEMLALQGEPVASHTSEAVVEQDALPLSQRVRWLLEDWGGRLDLSARQVARRLGMSERSLARGLSGEQTTFTGLRDEIRRDVAIRMLEGGERIESVSDHLGFSDTSSFHRAFRRWTDQSPGSFSPED